MDIKLVNVMQPKPEQGQLNVSAKSSEDVSSAKPGHDPVPDIRKEEARIEIKHDAPEEVVEQIRELGRELNTDLSFSVDKELDKVIISVSKPETDEIVRQIPTEEAVNIAKRLKEMVDSGEHRGMIISLEV